MRGASLQCRPKIGMSFAAVLFVSFGVNTSPAVEPLLREFGFSTAAWEEFGFSARKRTGHEASEHQRA